MKFKGVVSNGGKADGFGGSLKTNGGGIEANAAEKPLKAAESQQGCQARTALFVSPVSKFGNKGDGEVGRSDARPNRDKQSEECTTDSRGDTQEGGGSPMSGRDGR